MAELARGGVDYRQKPHDLKINCPVPHPKGADTGFHLEIRKDGTRAHCWVCDWSGSWNKLAPLLGLSPFGTPSYEGTYTKNVASSNVFGSLSEQLGSVFSVSDGKGELPHEIVPWDRGEWRGLSSSFLSSVSSYYWKHRTKGRPGFVPRILWPYTQLGNLVGYVGRRLDKIDDVKYYRAPWCHASKAFFPFDYASSLVGKSSDYVVLVEGEVDALNLCQEGIPSLSILGSTNWSTQKRDLLLHLGISSVFIMMDPDDAGKKAKRVLKRSLSPFFSSVLSIKLEEGTDPGDLSKEQLECLRQDVFQL